MTTDIVRSTLRRRAVEAVIWGIPIVNYDLMFQAFVRLGGGMNQIVYWSGGRFELIFGSTGPRSRCSTRVGAA